MQPQNCTTRLRRLVWTSFYVLCFFFKFIHLLWFFIISWVLIERGVHFFFKISVAFKNTTNCVSSALLDNDLQVFILNFVQTSLQEDILWYYTVIFFCLCKTGLSAKFLGEYLDACCAKLRRRTCGHNIIGPRLHRKKKAFAHQQGEDSTFCRTDTEFFFKKTVCHFNSM